VVHVDVARGVLADGERELRLRVAVGVALQQLPDEDRLTARVRHLDADDRLAGNGRQDAYRCRPQRHGEMVRQVVAPARLGAGRRLELEGRDDRARTDRDHLAGHAEVGELVLEDAGAGEERGLVDGLAALRRRVQEARRRQAIGVLAEELLLALERARALALGRLRLALRLPDDRWRVVCARRLGLPFATLGRLVDGIVERDRSARDRTRAAARRPPPPPP